MRYIHDSVKITKRQKYFSAICVSLFIAAIFIAASFYILPIGAKCGGNIGYLVNDKYYYSNYLGLFSHTPDSTELIKRVFFIKSWSVDDYGVYYTTDGRSVYVVEHDTGRSKKVYDTGYNALPHIFITGSSGGLVTIRYNYANDVGLLHCVRIDGKTGAVLHEDTQALYESIRYGNTLFPIGESVFSIETTEEGELLYRNNERFLPENVFIGYHPQYIGGNLLIKYRYGTSQTDEWVLIKPDGRAVDLPKAQYLTGTDDFLIYVDIIESEAVDVYCFDLNSGKTYLLKTDMAITTASTNGAVLYTSAPWRSRTDCWMLVYGGDGNPFGLELVVSDI